MSRRSLLAACGSFAAAVFFAALPVCAQTATEANSQPAPETATAAPPAPPIVEIDPLVAQVRQQLAGSLRGNIAAADRAAVVAFYADRTSLIWVSPSGFTARARHAMAEIAKADDWGLSASAFELPKLAAGRGGAAGARRCRDQAQPRCAQVCAPCARRPARAVPGQPQLRSEAHPARAQGGAGGDGGDRDAGRLPARPASQARAVRALAPGAAQGAQRWRPGRRRRPRPSCGCPMARRSSSAWSTPHVALLRQRLKLRSRAGRGDASTTRRCRTR